MLNDINFATTDRVFFLFSMQVCRQARVSVKQFRNSMNTSVSLLVVFTNVYFMLLLPYKCLQDTFMMR